MDAHLLKNKDDWVSRFFNDDFIAEDKEYELLMNEMLLTDEKHKNRSMEKVVDYLKLKYK